MMKLIALMLALTSLTAFAQRGGGRDDGRGGRGDGRYDLGNGRSIVRIEIGDDRDDDANLRRRIRGLEEAVRDLQHQVYQLQSAPQVPVMVTRHFCSANFFTVGTFSAKTSSAAESKASVISQCVNAARASRNYSSDVFCEAREVKCSKVEERM